MKKGGAKPPTVATEMETIKIDGKTIKFKKGALHRQLKVPEDELIGNPILRRIKKGEIGSSIKVRGKTFKITKLMQKRANFGLNMQGKG